MIAECAPLTVAILIGNDLDVMTTEHTVHKYRLSVGEPLAAFIFDSQKLCFVTAGCSDVGAEYEAFENDRRLCIFLLHIDQTPPQNSAFATSCSHLLIPSIAFATAMMKAAQNSLMLKIAPEITS